MKDVFALMAPLFWSVKNDAARFNSPLYRKVMFAGISSGGVLVFLTWLLGMAMTRLQGLSPDLFALLLIKGYSLIFMIVFFVQIVNGFIYSLDAFFLAKDLEILFTSPVERTPLFLSRLIRVHIKVSWMLIFFGVPLFFAAGILSRASLLYYVAVIILFAVFSTIPVNIGAALSLIFSNLFSVRRIKMVLLSSGVIVAALLMALLRIFRPERLVNPELFANITFFIAEVKSPSFILLPNRWMSESLFGFLYGVSPGWILLFSALLLSTSYITTAFLVVILRKYHYRGWCLLHERESIVATSRSHANLAVHRRRVPLNELMQRALMAFGKQNGTLLKKDAICQMRGTDIYQFLVLFLLVVIYLFSIAALPLNWIGYETQLKYLVSFFNLGLILVIVASLCSRLVYPSIVSEESSLWIVKTSPVSFRRFLWAKFLFFFFPVFLTGQLLTVASSLMIGLGSALIFLQSVTTALLSCSLLAMAVAFGSFDMRCGRENPSDMRHTRESVAYLLASVLLIFLTLALEVSPVFLYFLRESRQIVFTQQAWLLMTGIALVLIALHLLVTVFSVRAGVRVIEKLPF